MKLQDKLSAVQREVNFVAAHDDAKVEEIREVLKQARALVDSADKDLVLRRLGSRTQRFWAYLARLWKAIRGAA